MQNIDWTEIRSHIENLTSSGVARLHMPQLEAKASPEEALSQLQAIAEAGALLGRGLRPHMLSLDFFDSWWRRLQKQGVLQVLELKDVRAFCWEILALREACAQKLTPLEQSHLENLFPAEEPLSAIDQLISPQGEIRSDASEKLFQLFREKESLARSIQSHLDRLVKGHEIENSLQDKYVTTREGRWVLPIKSGHQSWMPGVVHGSSQTKQTVYLEPEVLIPQNNRLREVETEIEAEIEKLLRELSEFLYQHLENFRSAQKIMLLTDQLLAVAQFQSQVQAQRFEFSSEELALDQLVHPLLRLKPQAPVPNSLHLNPEKRILILSGPNAGGKTVLLKSLGLACHMARCGLPICAAEGSRTPFFSQISVVVGDAQSVESDLSTFAGHLRQLKEASERTSKPHLVLVDEICGSTDPEEGAALARSLIESFADRGAFALITSHLSQLKSAWGLDSPVLCGSMEFDSRTGRPSYHFLAGVPGDSLALQTASRVGVSDEILQRARELLSPSTRARLAQLDELQILKEDLKRAQALLEKERLQLLQEKHHLQTQQAELERSKSSELDKVRQEALKQVDELIALAKTETLFRKQASLVETRQKITEIVKAARPSPSTGDASFMPQSLEEFRRAFPSGSRVFVPSLQSDAVVQGEPNAKGMVFVLSQSMRLQIHWSELRPPRQMSNPTPQLVRRSGYAAATSLPGDHERELDLRGKNIEEALQNLERELDLCLQNKTDRLRIIHGYGTEALKRAIRHFLSRSEYVKKWNAGSPEQGGDGVTWVQLAG